jgi:hypothetical protein
VYISWMVEERRELINEVLHQMGDRITELGGETSGEHDVVEEEGDNVDGNGEEPEEG